MRSDSKARAARMMLPGAEGSTPPTPRREDLDAVGDIFFADDGRVGGCKMFRQRKEREALEYKEATIEIFLSSLLHHYI